MKLALPLIRLSPAFLIVMSMAWLRTDVRAEPGPPERQEPQNGPQRDPKQPKPQHPGAQSKAAATPDRARLLLREAIGAQGSASRATVRDVKLSFRGQATTPDRGTHAVQRVYWYRDADRAFRIRTEAKADGSGSERGVIGKNYWERTKDGVRRLRARNRDDRGSIGTIRKERRKFARMLRLVLLDQLDNKTTRVELASRAPTRITSDQPFDAAKVFPDRDRTYHVLSVQPEGEPRYLLFIETQTKRIRKAVQFHSIAANGIEFVYYFGAYRKDKKLGLDLPRFFSVHTAVPTDAKSRSVSGVVHGQLKLALNTDLKDADLKPN